MKRFLLVAVSFPIVALMLSISVSASTAIDTSKKGSISLNSESGKTLGGTLALYKVAALADDTGYEYVLTDDFKDSGVDLSTLDSAADELADTLASYVETKGLSGSTQALDGNGSVKFSDLDLGVYLIVQKDSVEGDYIVSPFLVTLPMSEDGDWIYDVDASLKPEIYKTVSVSVVKDWNDGEATSSRPSSISVTLYKGDEKIDQASLTAADNWTHTWTDLSESDQYEVKESYVSGYTATYSDADYSGKDYEFTITNTNKLAQTGQLKWPIPFIAGAGLLFFVIGWTLVNRAKDE